MLVQPRKNDGVSSRKKVFVTVGTTEFDQLIREIDSSSFLQCLKECGYDELSVQMGRGLYEPVALISASKSLSFPVTVYRFKPNLDKDMDRADLIISHCGAGSILEAVRKRKRLIVVINNSLQDNHQTELSDALTSEGDYYISTIPTQLISVLIRSKNQSTTENQTPIYIPINDSRLFCNAVEDMFEFSS